MTKLQRIAGFDAIIMPGFGERMRTPSSEVLQNVDECLKPVPGFRRSLPVPGGGDWAGTLANVYEKLKTADFGFVPGRGVFGHPMGPRGGAASLIQAWDAIKKGVPAAEYAKDHAELAAAFGEFG
jgi:ribulose-bisphosphate carboxylase large chain